MSADAIEALWRKLTADHDEEERLLLAAYHAADPKIRRANQLLEDRCRHRGCLLLDCWRSSGVAYVYLPKYKLSPKRNEETSVPAARERRTLDGDRIWRPRIVAVDDRKDWPAGWDGLQLHCDHLDVVVRWGDLIERVRAAIPGHADRRFYPC